MKRTQNRLNTARAAGAATIPGAKEHKEMKRKFGFTLVELLVVIAIISILAAIVTPRVQTYILRARATSTESEIAGLEVAITKMLTDSGKSSIRDMFESPPAAPPLIGSPPTGADLDQLKLDIGAYSDAIYALMRQGRNAADNTGVLPGGLKLAVGVKDKLATSYLDIGLDSWDRRYQFWAGPWGTTYPIPFRSFRAPAIRESDDSSLPYIYSADNVTINPETGAEEPVDRKQEMDDILPGNPPLDDQNGFPAPKDLVIYIFSPGVNGTVDQIFGTQTDPALLGGGDDINNWDKTQGWTGFYS
ncbi:MAG: prepilin-type N-terminal cleavage/methylation domain-containing protein [FCB group bacterium]|jgi:prepilin-type N-terminal cleavage/methylation domain-containing protein|nr:prepilin-type N-terminal cleavage/methylation domain-containing protein [FCB group bacterium]